MLAAPHICAAGLLLLLAGPGRAGASAERAQSEARRLRDLQRASGLAVGGADRLGVGDKYNPTAGTLPAFPNGTAGTFFSGVFTDHAVLQRAPAKAAVYGVIFGAEPATTVKVEVAAVGGGAFVCFSCESEERRDAIGFLLERHTPVAVPTVECGGQPEVIPLIQRHPVLAGSPLAEWFIEAQQSEFDAHGFEDFANELAQWQAHSYSRRVEKQRAAWQTFGRSYQKQLRATLAREPVGSLTAAGSETYTDVNASMDMAVPKKLARGGLPPEQRGRVMGRWARALLCVGNRFSRR